MNERIEELKKQAWEYTMAVHDGLVVPPPEKPVWPVDEVYEEKFAELIVRECVIRAEREWIRNGSDTEHNKAITGVIKSIKEHFGVKE